MLGKVLITGGTGYVGGWLTEALLNAGYEVTVLGRRPYPHPTVQNIIADITDAQALQKALSGLYFDTILHLAAADQRQDEKTLEQVNLKGTQNLIRAVAPPEKFIYLSTIKVYHPLSGHITEETIPQATQTRTYGRTKLQAELWLLNQSLGWERTQKVVLRLSNAYGAPKSLEVNTWHLLFNDLCRSAFEKGEIKLHAPPDTQLDMIWLGDVCNVILKAIEHPTMDGIFNLGAGKSVTTGEVAQAVARAYQQFSGKQLSIIQPEPAGNVPPLVFDCQKLQILLPYQPLPHFETEALQVFKMLEATKAG